MERGVLLPFFVVISQHMRYVGLDVSTTTIGISLLEDNKLISVEYYKPPKEGSTFARLIETRNYVINKVRELKPDQIIVEDIAKFMQGHSNAETILTLAIVNRTICLAIYEQLKIEPILMNVNTVRSIIRPKDYVGKLIKEDVPMAIEKALGIKFPYVYSKSRKGDKIAVESYDMADSIAVVLAYILNPTTDKKKTGRNKKK